MTNWIRIGLLTALFCIALACDVVGISEKALGEAECAQITDKIHEVLRQGLSEDQHAWWDENHAADRDESIRECVTDPVYGRSGFDCLMAAETEGDLKGCISKRR